MGWNFVPSSDGGLVHRKQTGDIGFHCRKRKEKYLGSWEGGHRLSSCILRQKGYGHRGCGDRRGYPGPPFASTAHPGNLNCWGGRAQVMGALWDVLQLRSKGKIKEWEHSPGTWVKYSTQETNIWAHFISPTELHEASRKKKTKKPTKQSSLGWELKTWLGFTQKVNEPSEKSGQSFKPVLQS